MDWEKAEQAVVLVILILVGQLAVQMYSSVSAGSKMNRIARALEAR